MSSCSREPELLVFFRSIIEKLKERYGEYSEDDLIDHGFDGDD